MKILKKVKKIIDNYKFQKVKDIIELTDDCKNIYHYINKNPESKIVFRAFSAEKDDSYLLRRYRDHIPKGWYGFCIGSPIIPVWSTIIEEILDVCIEADPNFEIHQIKLKFGGIRFYCESSIIEDLHEVESLIENTLFDEALIF